MCESVIIASYALRTAGAGQAGYEFTQVRTTPMLTDRNFASLVMGEERPVLLEFWAPWCKACARLKTTIGSVLAQYADQLAWVRANVEDCPTLRRRLSIGFLPALVVFSKGTEVERIHGIPSAGRLHSIVTRVLQLCPP